ncbi:Crp/Fnr family transcriptional regulator [uncultured Alistipes sp.]|uniref:Crp/Fnr family transcriptional regulator n=1 Tax=uncultured Alistipes sp. TaxID=538949 RepID=UPI002621D55B|nr:Crp/Fnr family transcriptional regulator [uncultured Alistipes sp.]
MDFEFYEAPLFRGCDRRVVDEVLALSPSRMSIYKKGDFIAMQHSVCRSLYILCKGSVCLQMSSEEGREFTLDTLAAPDVLASAFIFGTENILPVSIIANTDCHFLVISKECVSLLVERDKKVLHNFLTILSDHSLFLSRKLEQFALQTLSSRLIGYLRNNHAVQNLQETAFILGVTRPSLSRTVSQLVRQGIIRKSEKGYILS